MKLAHSTLCILLAVATGGQPWGLSLDLPTSDAAVPPWVGYNEEEEMKRQILDLSNDQRIFLRPPPSGVQFHFEFSKSYPVAMAILEEDDLLKKMRFELVPRK